MAGLMVNIDYHPKTYILRRNIMFKKVLLILTLGALAFTGCQKKESGPGGGAAEKVTLTVWESTNGPDEFIRQAGEAFTRQNPDITIKFVNVELGDAVNQISLDGPAGVGPDIFAAPHDRLGELVTNGHILPTENPGAIKPQLLGACATAATYNGTLYGYPVSAETYALFYNKARSAKTMCRKPGKRCSLTCGASRFPANGPL
jgi:arabinogalactan oligomer/maltooligosaccharide transport system substrate-binding protein